MQVFGKSSPTTPVTEQDTRAGRAIEHDSFAIIDAEAGPHRYDPRQWAIVRRMIHASADFELNGLTAFHPDAIDSGLAALHRGDCPLVADVAMITAGLSKARLQRFGLRTYQFIADGDVISAAFSHQTTRAEQAMRKADRQGLLEGAIVGIGNAPTALLEVVRLIEEGGVRPALVIGMPVGFVAAAESKARLAAVGVVPWITVQGRKGGSTLVVATIHALLALAAEGRDGPAPSP